MFAIGYYYECVSSEHYVDTSNVDHTRYFSSSFQKCASTGTYFAKASVQNWLQLTKVYMCLLIH